MMEERRTKRHELVPIEDMGVTDGPILSSLRSISGAKSKRPRLDQL